LISVIAEYPEAILGKAVNERYQGKLPLLVKFIDAKQDLSIQVHPNDEMAQREHGKMGKSEMWYVIRADEGAHLYAGFKSEITPEEYERRVAEGSIVEVLADHRVKAGDVFYLPAGRVHAICGGILLAEVQQSSDVTYRIYDYNRPGMDGKPRELHTELAARALNYHVEENYRTDYIDSTNRATQIIDTPYFDVRVMEISKPFHRDLRKYDSFIISMCIEGGCKICVRSTGTEILLRQGHSTLIPAAIADYDVVPLVGTTRLLDAFIDNQDNGMKGIISKFFHFSKE
jgi:mannose-6-phosphate isomerase